MRLMLVNRRRSGRRHRSSAVGAMIKNEEQRAGLFKHSSIGGWADRGMPAGAAGREGEVPSHPPFLHRDLKKRQTNPEKRRTVNWGLDILLVWKFQWNGDGTDAGDGSGGKAGEASSGSSGFRSRVQGRRRNVHREVGRGTDVPRASGCSGRKPARM